MEVLSCKKYNEKQTSKWNLDSDAYWQQVKESGEYGGAAYAPQLAFYIFNKNYGYVAFGKNKALWNKSKSGVINFWKSEEKKRLLRGW